MVLQQKATLNHLLELMQHSTTSMSTELLMACYTKRATTRPRTKLLGESQFLMFGMVFVHSGTMAGGITTLRRE